MTLQKPTQRRLAVLGLISVIAIACGSVLRTAVDRELIKPSTVIRFWSVASPFPSNREFYRLKAEHGRLQADASSAFSNGPDEVSPEVMQSLDARLKDLRGKYEAFLAAHPEHVLGLADNADLLAESGNRLGSLESLTKAARLSSKDADLWQELAARAVRFGEVKVAIPAFERAIELRPRELRLLRDFSNTLFVYRKDVMEHYQIGEAEVFDRSLKVHRRAMELYPQNMDLAVDFAMSHYSVKPARNEEAIAAWQHVHGMARSDYDKQMALLHIARFLVRSGDLNQAGTVLASITHPAHALLKNRVNRLVTGINAPEDLLPVTGASFETQ